MQPPPGRAVVRLKRFPLMLVFGAEVQWTGNSGACSARIEYRWGMRKPPEPDLDNETAVSVKEFTGSRSVASALTTGHRVGRRVRFTQRGEADAHVSRSTTRSTNRHSLGSSSAGVGHPGRGHTATGHAARAPRPAWSALHLVRCAEGRGGLAGAGDRLRNASVPGSRAE